MSRPATSSHGWAWGAWATWPTRGRRASVAPGPTRGRRAAHSSLRVSSRCRPPDTPAGGATERGQRSPAADRTSVTGDRWAGRRPRGHESPRDLLSRLGMGRPGGGLAGWPRRGRAGRPRRRPNGNSLRSGRACQASLEQEAARPGRPARPGGCEARRVSDARRSQARGKASGGPRSGPDRGSALEIPGDQPPGDADGAAGAPASGAGGGVMAGIGGLDGTGPPRVGYVSGTRIP